VWRRVALCVLQVAHTPGHAAAGRATRLFTVHAHSPHCSRARFSRRPMHCVLHMVRQVAAMRSKQEAKELHAQVRVQRSNGLTRSVCQQRIVRLRSHIPSHIPCSYAQLCAAVHDVPSAGRLLASINVALSPLALGMPFDGMLPATYASEVVDAPPAQIVTRHGSHSARTPTAHPCTLLTAACALCV
jgi:hypothetical protein